MNTEGTDNEYDVGVSLGGRIVPDKVFFFGTYNRQWQKRTFLAPNNAAPVFPYASLGGIDRKRPIHAYAGKISDADATRTIASTSRSSATHRG